MKILAIPRTLALITAEPLEILEKEGYDILLNETGKTILKNR